MENRIEMLEFDENERETKKPLILSLKSILHMEKYLAESNNQNIDTMLINLLSGQKEMSTLT